MLRRASVVLALAACAAPRAAVRPGVVVWSVGINQKEGPSPLVETILPASYQGREVWRVVHREGDEYTRGDLFVVSEVVRLVFAD